MHGLLNRLLKPTLHQRRGEDRRNVFPPSSRITMESRSLVESLTSSSDKPTSLSFESHSSSRDRPHPGLRSFQCSRFLHPFSSRFYPSGTRSSTRVVPIPLSSNDSQKRREKKRKESREFLPLQENWKEIGSFRWLEDRIERWREKKSAVGQRRAANNARSISARFGLLALARESTVRKIDDGVPTDRRDSRESNRPRLSCYRPLRVIKFPVVFTGQWPRPGRRGIQSP